MKLLNNKNGNTSVKVYFLIYFLILTWGVLLKFNVNIEEFRSNLIDPHVIKYPFFSEFGYCNRNDLLLNTLIFIPYGFFASAAWHKIRPVAIVFIVAATSAFYESTQYIFSIGYCDINDLISNITGGIIGIAAYFGARKICKEKFDKYLDIAAKLFTVLAVSILIAVKINKF